MLLNVHPVDFILFLKGKTHRLWGQLNDCKLFEIALLAHLDVHHNVEAGLAEVPLLPPFCRVNKYLLSTYYFSRLSILHTTK